MMLHLLCYTHLWMIAGVSLPPSDRVFALLALLGVLDIVADSGLIDFAEAIHRLETTTFRRPILLLLLEPGA